MPTNTEQDALVSVIIATYNRPAYLKEAIRSAVQQTYRNIEILVADNCSPENPQAIVESFQDSRIQFWRNPTNLGAFTNTMNAFKKARGKYVANLGDDDMWESEFLEKLVPHLEANPDVAIAFCDHYIIDANGTIDEAATEKYSRSNNRADLQEGLYQPFCKLSIVDGAVSPGIAAVIRKDVVEWDKIPSEVGGAWDMYINYLCCRSGWGAYYYPDKLTRYRVHPLSDTMGYQKKDVQTNVAKAKIQIFCYERFIEDERLQELRPYFKQKLADGITSLGIALLRGKQMAESRPYFWRALSQNVNLRTIAALVLSFTPQSFASRF